jgi:hypothetical protein
MYGEIPLGKGEDDGSVFSSFLKENRLPPELKSVSWEEIKGVLQVYKVCLSIYLFTLCRRTETTLVVYAVSLKGLK